MHCKRPQHRIGVGSELIQRLSAKVNRPVVLYDRVSHLSQKLDGNLDQAIEYDISRLVDLGIEPLEVFAGVEVSNIFGERPILTAAIEFSRKHDALLVAPSRERFLRASLWHDVLEIIRCKERNSRDRRLRAELPSVADYRELQRLAGGVPLATIIDPDAPATVVRADQTKRGQCSKARRGGGDRIPGYKKRRRERLKERLMGLLAAGGASSVRAAAAALGLPKSTVFDWLNTD